MAHPWSGVFPAATTHFNQDQTLDLEATQRHLDVIVKSGVSGVVMLGSLGEAVSLSFEEKQSVLRAALEAVGGRVPVLTGVAELSTAAAVRWVQDAERVGAEGAMVMPAMAYRADAEEACAHYSAVARSTSMPLIAYNNPIAYHVDLTPQVLEKLAQHSNYVAVKESCGDVRRITDLINYLGDRYTIFAGVDDLALESVFLGAKGWIAGIGLAYPEENQRLWNLAVSGKWEEARALYRWYSPLLHLDVGIKFVQNIKLAIQENGLGAEWVRLPKLPLKGDERERVLTVIRKANESRPRFQ